MRILIIVLSALLLLPACNAGDKKNRKTDKSEGNDPGVRTTPKEDSSAGKINDSSFTWTKKEIDKFVKECRAGWEQHVTGEELKDLCACLLGQSQRYYRTYREMEKESNDDLDAKILAGCGGYADEEEDDK